jgi:ABC-type nitrate/sulfonate/bicarbonate transport system ATPase subunit
VARASIARARSFEPEMLLMDVPFGALDEIIRHRVVTHRPSSLTRIDLSLIMIHKADE